jgi:hypothetical protein
MDNIKIHDFRYYIFIYDLFNDAGMNRNTLVSGMLTRLRTGRSGESGFDFLQR